MLRHLRDFVSLNLVLSLALVTPAPVFATSPVAKSPVTASADRASVSTADLQTLMRNDSQLIYWSTLEDRNPMVGGFALDGSPDEKPLWTVNENDSLVDKNPFFMRSQSWSDSAQGACSDGVCFTKTAQGLSLQFGAIPKTLVLKEAMTPILDTDQYLFMSADNQDVFKEKLGENTDVPGEGFFFIAKKDLAQALQYNSPLPIFFAPTVGTGWTGPQPHAVEFANSDPLNAQYIFPDRDGDPLTLDHTDIMALEKVSRNNLQLAQSWAALEGATGPRGAVLPKIGTTMTFGLQLTGQLPRIPQTFGERAKQNATQVASSVWSAVLPTAEAHSSRLQVLRERLLELVRTRAAASMPPPPNDETNPPPQESPLPPTPTALPVVVPLATPGNEVSQLPMWRRWVAPGILYGATAGLAAAAYQDIDWKALITADMPKRITYISMIFGGVALTSYMLKIGPYKDKLARLYPTGKVLVISSNESARKGLVKAISRAKNGEIIEASSKAEVDKLLAENEFDLVFQESEDASLFSADTARLIKEKNESATVVTTDRFWNPDVIVRDYSSGLKSVDSKRMAAAKSFLTIFSQGLWTSFAGISMMIRQTLDFGKDRFFPNNKVVHKAWEATMGFALKSSSSITTNWKTALLGWTFGLADATMVAVDLLIFAPWLMQKWGMDDVGAHTVAYASAAVLSQFVTYAQVGPHGYAQDTKTIHFQSAENEARRLMALEGLDPENSRHEGRLNKLTAIEMEKRFKAVGLPSDDEFFFDPLSIWHKSLKNLGFSADRLQNMSEEEREKLAEQDFILSHRHLGLIKPAIKSALAEAIKVNNANPSPVGAQTVELLSWALKNRSLTKPILGRVYETFSTTRVFNSAKDAVDSSVANWLANDKTPNFIGKYWAISRGLFDYLAADATKVQRDQRSVLFVMSTSNTEAAIESLKFLPQSWIDKAGSKEAAGLGAELFHRHFTGFIEKEIGRVQKSDKLEAELGPRADTQLSKMDAGGVSTDAFTRAIRRNTVLTKLKTIDDEQKEIDAWQPPHEDWLARRQWRIAKESAREAFGNGDDQISEEWISVTKAYASTLNPEAAEAFEIERWTREQQFRFLFAQKFAKQVGLHVSNVENSEFVQKVMVKAVQATDGAMRKGRLAYYTKLNEVDKQTFMARVFTENFINTYIGMSVNSDLYLKAASPEYPGRLQRARQFVLGTKHFKWLQKPMAIAEMFGRNETSAFQPGFDSMADRSIPFFPDLAHNFVRTLRYVPYAIGPSYLTQRFVFQIPYPYVMWVATVLFGSTNGAFVEANNRVMRNLDKKPMGGIPEKLLFARTHAFFTNPQAVLELMYAEPIVRNVNDGVGSVLNKCDEILRSVGKGIKR